jgi:hypothetical protein
MAGFMNDQQKILNEQVFQINGKGEVVVKAEEYVVPKRPIRLMEVVAYKRQKAEGEPPFLYKGQIANGI